MPKAMRKKPEEVRAKMQSFRLNEAEERDLIAAAKAKHVPVGEYARSCLLVERHMRTLLETVQAGDREAVFKLIADPRMSEATPAAEFKLRIKLVEDFTAKLRTLQGEIRKRELLYTHMRDAMLELVEKLERQE